MYVPAEATSRILVQTRRPFNLHPDCWPGEARDLRRRRFGYNPTFYEYLQISTQTSTFSTDFCRESAKFFDSDDIKAQM